MCVQEKASGAGSGWNQATNSFLDPEAAVFALTLDTLMLRAIQSSDKSN